MNTDDLQNEYRAAKKTESFSDHQKFIKDLLKANDPAVIAYHFDLLKDRSNRKLYQRLRAAFKQRGSQGAEYLVKRIQTEADPDLLGDAMHLLGGMNCPEAIPLARRAVTSLDPSLRDKAVYVLGWVGTEDDEKILRDRLLNDPDPEIRGNAATALDQMRMRLPDLTDRLLDDLKKALESEKDEEVLAAIIITIQYFLRKKFGLKENIDEGTITGNVTQAREKARAALMKRTT